MGSFLDVLEVRRRQLPFASATLLARLREIGGMEYLQPFSFVFVGDEREHLQPFSLVLCGRGSICFISL